MGKKKTRSKYTSSGKHKTVTRSVLNACRKERRAIDRLLNQLEAWSKGRRTMITIENPNKNETNKKFIRVEGNIVFGPWKRSDKPMKVTSDD